MKSFASIKNEHESVCAAMKKLERTDGGFPVEGDTPLYLRLAAVKNTLEWVCPQLVKIAKGSDRLDALMGYKHIASGPTFAQLYP